jgi:hypothetical protein
MGRRPKTNAGLEITAAFIEALTADFAANGVATLERLRAENPGAYCKLAADLTPKSRPEVESQFDSMSLEDLRRYCGEDDDGILAKMVENLPRYDRLLKRARKLAKAQPDPNPANGIAAALAAAQVPWRRTPCAVGRKGNAA